MPRAYREDQGRQGADGVKGLAERAGLFDEATQLPPRADRHRLATVDERRLTNGARNPAVRPHAVIDAVRRGQDFGARRAIGDRERNRKAAARSYKMGRNKWVVHPLTRLKVEALGARLARRPVPWAVAAAVGEQFVALGRRRDRVVARVPQFDVLRGVGHSSCGGHALVPDCVHAPRT